MRRTLPTRGLKTILLTSAIALVVAGCTDESPEAPPAPQTTATASSESVAEPVEPAVDKLPVDAAPQVPGGRTSWQECPYLDTQWVADTNGQRVTGVGVDERFSTPACVYWSFPEEPQLTVIVREMDTIDEAIAVVDWAAPVDTTELAEEPAGWSGGRRGGDGALYAVQKDTVAVVVFTNQDQSLKAQLVAETVIGNLGL
ncbi:DUF2020 domain-containing protein [Corynebacterium gallinarum]|uniref:DUF2020 domain-containing protein n=1 Tax=Corynebacterium gallinarum TaxID=2762214 RepID=A0A8I0HJC0_9CORY|nr:DUF2020 domain-containing protein [Corynebacterium gallinarum]MBD8031108.1 DUF2020 domain-containing protein [Corynebacterium gallinarum]